MSKEMHLISRAGKTFYFATFWLPRAVRHDAARAYNFCRAIDDIADAHPPIPTRNTYLQEVRAALLNGDTAHELVVPLTPLLSRFPEIRLPLAALVDACRYDTPDLTIHNERDLERYAHGVAGNVGLIMYPILGGTCPSGRRYAADLGIAMQYTNIARDVREDIQNGRVYLPTSWLSGATLSNMRKIDPEDETTVLRAIEHLLTKAEEHYQRGLSGLAYLSRENRFAIRVAALCYRAIGDRVRSGAFLSGTRAVVSIGSKLTIACKAALQGGIVRSPLLPNEVQPTIAPIPNQSQQTMQYKTGVG